MKRDRILFFLHLAAVLVTTLVHEAVLLSTGLIGILLLAGRQAPHLLRRTLRVVLVFNLTVSLGYRVLAHLPEFSPREAVLLINLWVLLPTLLPSCSSHGSTCFVP